MITLRLLCLAALSYQALACTGGMKQDVFKRMVGKDVTKSTYYEYSETREHREHHEHSSGGRRARQSGANRPVSSGDELSCGFDSSCCWSNAHPPNDQADWDSLTGATEKKKLQSSFSAGEKPPDGNFLGVGTEKGSLGSPQTAHFYSCPIQCADGPIDVRLKHWQTKDVTLQVCKLESAVGEGPISSCRPLSKLSGDLDGVTVPGGANTRVVIVATGFTEKKGSVALIDDLGVSYTPCSSSARPDNQCAKITCNFEAGNPCSYGAAQGAGGSKSWEVVRAPYQNPLTGIPKASEGQAFAGAYLNPGDTAVMSTDVNYPENYVVKFSGYRATEGVDLSACCGSPNNCPYLMSKQVQVSDFKNWQPATLTCPPGTKKVMFLAKNSGKNQGAVGLDNVQLLVPGGQPAC